MLSNKIFQHPVKPFFRSLLFGLGLLFLAIMAVYSWPDLHLLLKQIRWPFFLLAMVVAIMGNLITSFLMRELFAKYGLNISFSLGHKVYFYAQIAKYIPGKVWAFWYQATLLNAPGSTSAMLFVNLELTFLLVILTASLAFALLLIPYSVIWALIVFGFGLLLSVWVLKDCHLFALVHRGLSSIKFFADKLCTCQNCLHPSKIVTFYFLFSCTYLISNLLVIYAAFGFSLAQSIDYTAYLSLAWICGALFFVVPGGVGVKEFVFIMLARIFSGDISLEALGAIAIIFRFSTMLQELLGVGLVFLLDLSE